MRFLKCSFLMALGVWGGLRPLPLTSASGSEAQSSYVNPVIHGDYPDPSIIRQGTQYWATATSSEWGPQFPLLRSSDLINWEQTSVVFPHRPAWAEANFWAPEISEYNGRYFVYYVGRKKGGPLAVAVASADIPQGPYTDHGPLVAQDAGSIDPMAVTDEKGRRYLLWKEDGNSRRLPTVLWAQQLTDDGLALVGKPAELFRNNAPWEGAVVEGPFVLRRGSWFYLFYSGSACCGSECNYALGVARAPSLLGPWEKNPANPILAGNSDWRCPGHGSIVQDTRSRYWLLYHAYAARGFIFTGREALLDEVVFGSDDWPTINGGHGPSKNAAAPFATTQRAPLSFEDDFSRASLRPGWQWPQNLEPAYTTGLKQGAHLSLSSGSNASDEILGAILARASLTGDYMAETVLDVSHLKPHVFAGLAAIGDVGNAIGIAAHDSKVLLWRRDRGRHQELADVDAPKSGVIHLRIKASRGNRFLFATSANGQRWIPVGDSQRGDKLPPWDRSMRVGLTVGGANGATASFGSFALIPAPTQAP